MGRVFRARKTGHVSCARKRTTADRASCHCSIRRPRPISGVSGGRAYLGGMSALPARRISVFSVRGACMKPAFIIVPVSDFSLSRCVSAAVRYLCHGRFSHAIPFYGKCSHFLCQAGPKISIYGRFRPGPAHRLRKTATYHTTSSCDLPATGGGIFFLPTRKNPRCGGHRGRNRRESSDVIRPCRPRPGARPASHRHRPSAPPP